MVVCYVITLFCCAVGLFGVFMVFGVVDVICVFGVGLFGLGLFVGLFMSELWIYMHD